LEEYDNEIVSNSGPQNGIANALCRISAVSREEGNPETLDEKVKTEISREYNNSMLRGHRGLNKTYEAIKERYSLANIRKETEKCVKKFEHFQMNKLLRPKKEDSYCNYKHSQPFEKCALDIV
jgi:AICAR transformylase/IMP cyclohydrolase PurH